MLFVRNYNNHLLILLFLEECNNEAAGCQSVITCIQSNNRQGK